MYGSLVLKTFLHEHLFKNDPNYRDHYIAISPDEGGFKRTSKYAKLFGLLFVSMDKKRDYSKENVVEKTVLHGDSQQLAGKTAIIFDDIADTCGTILSAAKTLKENGAKDVIVIVTHGILSGPGLERISNSPDISKFICSDSIDQGDRPKKCSKMLVFSIAPLYTEIVRRLINHESLSELFE